MTDDNEDRAGRIEVAPNVDAFFEEVVHEAIVARQLEATDAAEHYLALMLSEYARGHTPAEPFDRPLTFQLRDALALKGMERFEQLRRIGDAVLYVLGFFDTALTRRTNRDYVITVGSSAYGHASAMLEVSGTDSGHNVLEELARKYDRFVDVLALVADNALATSRDDASVLRLYERWQKTGSDRLAEALVAAGMWPRKSSGGLN